jgi:hypothetical protein
MRHHRRGRAAEPERAGVMTVSAEQRQTLRLLAGSPDGNTESILLAHGFGIGTLRGLVRDGLATASRENARGGRQIIAVTRLRITDAGRRALAEP